MVCINTHVCLFSAVRVVTEVHGVQMVTGMYYERRLRGGIMRCGNSMSSHCAVLRVCVCVCVRDERSCLTKDTERGGVSAVVQSLD